MEFWFVSAAGIDLARIAEDHDAALIHEIDANGFGVIAPWPGGFSRLLKGLNDDQRVVQVQAFATRS